MVLCSAAQGTWARHSMCAHAQGVLRITRAEARWIGDVPHPAGAPPRDPLAALAWADAVRTHGSTHGACPGAGAWIAVLNYELGELLEPAVCNTPSRIEDDRNAPLAEFLWCPQVTVQDPDTSPTPGGDPLQQRSPCDSSPPEPDHRDSIAEAVEAIHAGDVFQVNIARRLTMAVDGDPLTWSQHAITSSLAPFGAMVRLPGDNGTATRMVTSMSPELFLHVDAQRHITSRPIKGTASADQPIDALRDSTKDAAELHMIVDLVRNDLGRVSTTGSVQVHSARELETHVTVHHGVAEVRGRLRDDVNLVDLLRATFPPGSITGAPKIRAMQLIRELETRPRGAYCGAIGLLGPDGTTMLSVAIRTATVLQQNSECTLDYGTGGGITAQSDPDAEVRETQVKAQALWASITPNDAAHPHDEDHAPHEAVAATPCDDAVRSH